MKEFFGKQQNALMPQIRDFWMKFQIYLLEVVDLKFYPKISKSQIKSKSV